MATVTSKQPDIKRFHNRLQAMLNLAGQWKKEINDKKITVLLEEFSKFASEYFAYFADIESTRRAKQLSSGRREPSLQESYELSTVLGRLQQEWTIISRACGQRRIKEYEDMLQNADGQAARYYARFSGYKGDSKLPPITYFEKLYAITRTPFAPYPPLISIPLQVYNAPQEWQGLAHELGHYIYWNSASLPSYREAQDRLRNNVLDALHIKTNQYKNFRVEAKVFDIWDGWIEEAFADTCGTLLAGPAYALAAQHLAEATDPSPTSFVLGDTRHPPPALRPRIAIETLTWVLGQLEQKAQQKWLQDKIEYLKERWRDRCPEGCKNVVHGPSNLPLSDIEKPLENVVRAILGDPKDHKKPRSWVSIEGPQDLGQLINYEPWLEQEPTTSTTEGLPYLPPSDKPSKFDELIAHLQGQFTNLQDQEQKKKKIREALLKLDLEERPLGQPYYAYVMWVGYRNGDHVLY